MLPSLATRFPALKKPHEPSRIDVHAKPAVALGGKDRLIDRPVSNRIKSGIARIDALT
jgi:hypothetical protein